MDLTAAREAYAAFTSQATRPTALHDCDADGLSAGVIWQRTLERLGRQPQRLVTDRARNAWSEANRERLKETRPDRLFVLDLGCRSEPLLAGVPTCLVDHHRPEPPAPGDLLLSGYEWDPIPTTSWLAYELGAALVDLQDLEWVAALGVVGDLGEKAPFELLARAKKTYKARYLKEAVVLLNTARRASTYGPERAARALLEHADPAALVNSDSSDVEFLRACREEIAGAMNEGKKASPKFAGQAALIQVHTPCQIHPLLAQIWRGRLPRYYVIVANTGYMPGRVNFSARSSGPLKVLDFLQQHRPQGDDVVGEVGNGHDQASGGSLDATSWNRFLTGLGFGAESLLQT